MFERYPDTDSSCYTIVGNNFSSYGDIIVFNPGEGNRWYLNNFGDAIINFGYEDEEGNIISGLPEGSERYKEK